MIVYGDPDFYGRFGFDAKLGESFIPPHPLEYPFGWQALQLNPYDICDVAQSIRCIGPLDNPKLW